MSSPSKMSENENVEETAKTFYVLSGVVLLVALAILIVACVLCAQCVSQFVVLFLLSRRDLREVPERPNGGETTTKTPAENSSDALISGNDSFHSSNDSVVSSRGQPVRIPVEVSDSSSSSFE